MENFFFKYLFIFLCYSYSLFPPQTADLEGQGNGEKERFGHNLESFVPVRIYMS